MAKMLRTSALHKLLLYSLKLEIDLTINYNGISMPQSLLPKPNAVIDIIQTKKLCGQYVASF